MRLLLLGSTGKIGSEIISANTLFGFNLIHPNSKQLNITDPFLSLKLCNINPDLIINAAAYTDVDNAEISNKQAYNVNKKGPQLLAQACQDMNIPIIHISTDFVFSGNKDTPYVEEDVPDPINIYGKSKLNGEEAVLNSCEKHIILRTSWVFGENGGSFVKTILKLATEKPFIKVVENEISCPTTSSSIAHVILTIIKQIQKGNTEWGLYHFCGSPEINRYAYALEIIENAKKHTSTKFGKIQAITMDQFPTKAKRPTYSAMNTDKIFGVFNILPNNWRSDLSRIVPSLLKQL